MPPFLLITMSKSTGKRKGEGGGFEVGRVALMRALGSREKKKGRGRKDVSFPLSSSSKRKNKREKREKKRSFSQSDNNLAGHQGKKKGKGSTSPINITSLKKGGGPKREKKKRKKG